MIEGSALAGGDLAVEPARDRWDRRERLAAVCMHVVHGVQAARGRSRASRAARHRRYARACGRRSATDRILSTCSWSSTTAKRHVGVFEHVGHLVGDRVGIDRHRHGAERLRGNHRPIEPRPVGADDRDFVAALHAERAAGRRAKARTFSSICAQVQVCQMPRSLCRIAGRAPNSRALRINSLGNVSACSGGVSATARSSRSAAPVAPGTHPSPPLTGGLVVSI